MNEILILKKQTLVGSCESVTWLTLQVHKFLGVS